MRSIFKDNNFLNVFTFIKQKSKWTYDRITKGYCEYDSYEVNSWFLETAPELIDIVEKEMDGTCTDNFIRSYLEEHFNKYNITYKQYSDLEISKEKQEEIFNICTNEYHKVLKEMSFCLKEADPETCSKINKYKAEYDEYKSKLFKINDKICDDGKITTKEGSTMIKDCMDKNLEIIKYYRDEEEQLRAYRDKCKKRGLELFVKYFDDIVR